MNKMIIHFGPLELYPPVQNLIRELEKENQSRRFIVLTTAKSEKTLTTFQTTGNIEIIRLGRSGRNLRPLDRYLNYLIFYSTSLFYLWRYRPHQVMYFETISSWPV